MIEHFIINGKRAIAATAGEMLKVGLLGNDPKDIKNKRQLILIFADGDVAEISREQFKAMKRARNSGGMITTKLEVQYEV